MAVNRGLYRGAIPQITWGPGFANPLTFAQPLDEATCYEVPRDTARRTDGLTGTADGWSHGMRGLLEGTVRRIPMVDTAGVTGWEGAAGWDAFLASARDAQPFRFYPDLTGAPATYWTCLLADDVAPGHDEEPTRHRRLTLRMWQADQSPFVGY